MTPVRGGDENGAQSSRADRKGVTLRDVAAQMHAEYGHVLIVAAHSMPSTGRRIFGGRHVRRADIVPGTRGRSTADGRIIDVIDSHFRDAGLSVKHDEPYRGGWTTGSYGAPKRGQHAVQIELNRALYVDEQTSEVKQDDFDRLQRLLDGLVDGGVVSNTEEQKLGDARTENITCFVVQFAPAELGDPVIQQPAVSEHCGDNGLQQRPVLLAEAVFGCVALDQ